MVNRAFYEALPSKRMAAGCIFLNAEGEVLLVKPTYKDGWEIPGGVVEVDESPKTCCEREVMEEIGLAITVKRLLVVDYNSYPDEPHKTESLMFIFDGGVLSDEDLSKIQLNDGEISRYECFPIDGLPTVMNSGLRNRVIQAVKQREHHGAVYLENQEIV